MKSRLGDDAGRVRWRDEFIRRISLEHSFNQLFDHIEGFGFFAKDAEGRFVAANPAIYRHRFHLECEEDLLGRTDADFLPPALVRKYRIDDGRILATGEPILAMVEILPDRQGIPEWIRTSKLPIRSHTGEMIGVMGVLQRLDMERPPMIVSKHVLKAFKEIRSHSDAALSIQQLADDCGCSTRQLERSFKTEIGMSPRELLVRSRIKQSCLELRNKRKDMPSIASTCGFYDQSSFCRQFKKQMGLTPSQYRAQYGLREG